MFALVGGGFKRWQRFRSVAYEPKARRHECQRGGRSARATSAQRQIGTLPHEKGRENTRCYNAGFMFDRKSFLLVVISTVVALLLCEGGLRLVVRYRSRTPPAYAPVEETDLGPATRFVAGYPALPDTDRGWFLEDPPPLTNRTKPGQQATDRYNDFVRRGLYGPQAQYIWNRKYFESEKCKPNGVFKGYPDTILTFDPPRGSEHPTYRFPIGSTLPSGLVTNQFGLRGPEVALVKPPKTIRIAFVGASTTINVHRYDFSPSERVVGWLNRYAQTRGLDVRFEVLNAGREGINSEDIAAIVRSEVAALDPDLVVYYEGSNQFNAYNLVGRTLGRDRMFNIFEWFRNHTAMGELITQAGMRDGSEPPKPWHSVKWPAGVDWQAPDVDSPNLPLELPTIVHDLDTIREAVRPGGGRLVLCSFQWLVRDGLLLSGGSHRYIYDQLNSSLLWPLTYREVRSLSDFQNLVFRRYAAKARHRLHGCRGRVAAGPGLLYGLHSHDVPGREGAGVGDFPAVAADREAGD